MWFLSTTTSKRWDPKIKECNFLDYADPTSFMKKCQDLSQPEMPCNVVVIIKSSRRSTIKSTKL